MLALASRRVHPVCMEGFHEAAMRSWECRSLAWPMPETSTKDEHVVPEIIFPDGCSASLRRRERSSDAGEPSC